jgi:hypothetical protein
MCTQLVIAATALLIVPQHIGTTSGSAAGEPDSIAAATTVAWHITDALPGPDIPTILDWRLTTDIGGRWAGLVTLIAIGSILGIAVFPLARAVMQWATIKAGQPRYIRPTAGIPAIVLHDLESILAFVTSKPPDVRLDKVRKNSLKGRRRAPLVAELRQLEQQLIDAECARPALRQLLGSDAPMYQAAGEALNATARLYRTAVGVAEYREDRIDAEDEREHRMMPDELEQNTRTAIEHYRRYVMQWQKALEPSIASHQVADAT